MHCNGCHTRVQDYWNFCVVCGRKLVKTAYIGDPPVTERRLELIRANPPDVRIDEEGG